MDHILEGLGQGFHLLFPPQKEIFEIVALYAVPLESCEIVKILYLHFLQKARKIKIH